jgi:putative hemolysin
MRSTALLLGLLIVMLIVAACGAGPEPTPTTFESPVELANPASQYCVDQGFELEMRTTAEGTTGYCLFDDGTECEEWAYYRGECGPGTPKP